MCEAPGKLLEKAFQRIDATRMADFPLRNPLLHVEAIGFRLWLPDSALALPALWLGVLLTPWFMNLMLLPTQAGCLPKVAPAGEAWLVFAGYSLPFLAGEEDEVGEYRLCSLCSPPSQFADQETARKAALSILDTLTSAPAENGVNTVRRRLFGLAP